MSSIRQRSIPLGGRYRQVSLYHSYLYAISTVYTHRLLLDYETHKSTHTCSSVNGIWTDFRDIFRVGRTQGYRHQLLSWGYDDVINWKHFSRYWTFERGIHRWPVNPPSKSQWRGASMLCFICVWTNDWINNRDPGDLRRHRAHHDVTVMDGVGDAIGINDSCSFWMLMFGTIQCNLDATRNKS